MTPEQAELLRGVSLLLPGTKLARVEPMERNSLRITDRDGDHFYATLSSDGTVELLPIDEPA